MRCWVVNGKGGHPILMVAVIVMAAACAEKKPSVETGVLPAPPPLAAVQPVLKISTPTSPPTSSPRIYKETGIASWYGREFQGRKSASGELFDMFALSATHRTLPLGSFIQITNLDNSKSISVKVIDRGPFSGNKILELSYGAARELGFAGQGTAIVEIQAEEQPRRAGFYTVQAAVFSEEESARLLKERLSVKYEFISVLPFETNLGKFYRVRIGAYGTEEKAESIARKLKLEGLEPFVMRKD